MRHTNVWPLAFLILPGKSWNLINEFFSPGKSWKMTFGRGNSGKVVEFFTEG